MNKTQNYYNQNHKALIERYSSTTLTNLNQLFNKYIKQNSRVLDIGFGSGRDLRYIKSLKVECYGVDSCQGFVDALCEDDYFKDRIFLGQLPNLNLDIDFKFDVIVLVAVLMHLSKDEIVDSIESIKRYLVDGGVVIVNYSVTPREDDEKHIYIYLKSQLSFLERFNLGLDFELFEDIQI